MTGFNRSTLTPTAHSAVRPGGDENVEWLKKIREQREAMMPPIVPQPEPPAELLAAVLYHSPAWVTAREAAAQVETESKRPRQRRKEVSE